MSDQKIRLTFLVWTGLGSAENVDCYYHQIKQAELVYLHEAADELYFYAEAMIKTIPLLEEDNTDRMDLLLTLDRAFYEIVWDEGDCFYASVERALEKLKSELANRPKKSSVRYTVLAIPTLTWPGCGD